jgi:hypothetical protein
VREHTFKIASSPRLIAQLPAGALEVDAQPGTEAFVRLTPVVDDEESREVIERAQIELFGNELVVKVKDRRFGLGRQPEIRAEIRCPERTKAEVHVGSADIRMRGVLADVKTHVASGDVELDRVEGRLQAHAASGDLEVGFVRDDVEAHSASGDVSLRRSEGGVSVRSASGTVALGDAGGGPVHVQSASGDISIGVRSGRRVAVDVRTVSGQATSEIPLDDPGGEDGDAPLVEIKATSVSGDVRIERAADPAALEV